MAQSNTVSKDESNVLAEWIALKGTTEIYDIFKKLGFRDVGSVVKFLQTNNEYEQLIQKIKDKIENIRNHPSDYEVACGEGETCTVAERTEDILQELLSKKPNDEAVSQ